MKNTADGLGAHCDTPTSRHVGDGGLEEESILLAATSGRERNPLRAAEMVRPIARDAKFLRCVPPSFRFPGGYRIDRECTSHRHPACKQRED